MWFVRRSLGTCVRRAVPIAVSTSFAPSLRFCATISASPPPAEVAAFNSSLPSVSLTYTCRLLDTICAAKQPEQVKRKRVRGAVHKMESSIVDSFAAASAIAPPQKRLACLQEWLRALAQSVEYLPRHDLHHSAGAAVDDEAERFSSRSPRRTRSSAAAGEADDDAWSGASPYFTLQTNDVLCLCLRECAMAAPEDHTHRAAQTRLRSLLQYAVVLELGDVEVLRHLVHALTTVDACRHLSPQEAVPLLHFISLAVKRCKLPAPPLDRLLSLLPGATLTARESLLVLGALHRMPTVHAGDVVASVSRRAAPQVATYNVKDVVYGLEVSSLLAGCSEVYAAAVLDRAGALSMSMTPHQLGSVCKYVALFSPARRQNTLAYACGAELRRLLPLLVERAEQLVRQFHLRDSRNVLRCFREHKVRHSLIFSRLTPIADDN